MVQPAPTSSRWATVRDDDDPGAAATLVVDFVNLTSGPTAADVVASAVEGPVLRADPIDELDGLGQQASIEDLATHYATCVRDLPRRVALLVGHCSSAPLVLALARRLGEEGYPPVRVLLLAPGFPDVGHVHDELEELRRSLGCLDPAGRGPEDTALLRTHLAASLHTALIQAVEAMGADEDEADVLVQELGGRMLAWLNYLVSATEIDSWQMSGWDVDVHVLSSGDSLSTPSGGWPARTRVVTIPMDRVGLVGSDDLTSAVRAAVARA